LELTDELIDGAIDSITGFIAAKISEQRNIPVVQIMEHILLSNAYRLLSDKKTGFYWDNLREIYDMFIREIGSYNGLVQ
jgi:C4-dicarboxylate-specific signal transduction histidine kinase